MDTIRFFKDLAKARLKQRRAAGHDGSALQRTQHEVAVDAGFRSWGDMLASGEDERDLAALMLREPTLNWAGFGPGDFAKTRSERDAQFAQWRVELRESADHVAQLREWLVNNADPRKTVNDRAYSYKLKHLAEEELGSYVSNGEIIAAAILAGYSYEDVGLNANFGISQYSMKALEERRRARRGHR